MAVPIEAEVGVVSDGDTEVVLVNEPPGRHNAAGRGRRDKETVGSAMTTEHGYSADKSNYANRMRRIEGQVRGIAKMIDEDKYCIDVLTQISAVNSALRSVALNLLDEHLGHCVTRAIADGGDEANSKITEASAAIARLVRS